MKIKNQCLSPISVPNVTGTTLRILRCGHCANCIKQKKNELAVRTFREFTGQEFALLTFTYSDDNCPVQITEVKQLSSDVPVVTSRIVRGRDTDFFQNAPFEWKTNKSGKRSKRYKPLIFQGDDSLIAKYYSVFYQDLKNALKRFRIKHPRTLHQFIAVPEYGSLTYRPHYHMLVLGMSDDLLADLAAEWPYGNVDVDNGKDPTKQNDPSKISQYIAKYCVKGKYDCPFIKEGYCIKPRRSVSKNYGLGQDFLKLVDVLLCKQELGIDNPWQEIELSESQLTLLASRRKFVVNGYNYVLPKYLVNKAFKQTIKTITYEITTRQSAGSCRVLRETKTAGFKVPLSIHDQQEFERIKDYCAASGQTYEVRYHSVSSPLQRQVAGFTLARLVVGARRQLEKELRSLPADCDFDSLYAAKEAAELAANAAMDRAAQTDLEANSLY